MIHLQRRPGLSGIAILVLLLGKGQGQGLLPTAEPDHFKSIGHRECKGGGGILGLLDAHLKTRTFLVGERVAAG